MTVREYLNELAYPSPEPASLDVEACFAIKYLQHLMSIADTLGDRPDTILDAEYEG